jgi:hypothetical protein
MAGLDGIFCLLGLEFARLLVPPVKDGEGVDDRKDKSDQQHGKHAKSRQSLRKDGEGIDNRKDKSDQ